jgi:hypothetical protein
MLTRALFMAAGWFVLAFIGLLIFGLREKRRSWLLSFGWLFFVVLASGIWAFLTFGVPREIILLSAIALVTGFLFIVWLRDWNAFGQVLWTATVLITIIFLSYSFTITAFTPLSPLSFLTSHYLFLCRSNCPGPGAHAYLRKPGCDHPGVLAQENRPAAAGAWILPKVSLHVPTYNEPPEVVEKTLQLPGEIGLSQL